ncbi:hypothetical protein [Sphingomonas glaciei]|uniref:Uncharacterized protein n=1 Tax=Sphingomonas glaciei TaxID=2938948 RepID=A0ABY5MY37_9SPHN|nr:hypothetical protein [Sphingomonas glaciei]UUR09365.1 hypothetical protein M1K48_07065 [Sphingomonas glaciei]
MNRHVIILRETMVSIVINMAITAGFFFALFGLSGPIDGAAYGKDFLPQSFMVALMGALIPGLLVRRGSAARIPPVVVRAVLLALGALLIGFVCWWLFARVGSLQPVPALVIKLVYAAILSMIVTPISVGATLAAMGTVTAGARS